MQKTRPCYTFLALSIECFSSRLVAELQFDKAFRYACWNYRFAAARSEHTSPRAFVPLKRASFHRDRPVGIRRQLSTGPTSGRVHRQCCGTPSRVSKVNIADFTVLFFCAKRRQILCSHRSCPEIAADVPESHIGLYEFVCAARRSKRRSFDTKRPSGAYKFKRIYIGLRPSYLARCSPISYPKRWLSHRKNLYISVDFDILCNF
jgi:hypothetical protein